MGKKLNTNLVGVVFRNKYGGKCDLYLKTDYEHLLGELFRRFELLVDGVDVIEYFFLTEAGLAAGHEVRWEFFP